VPTDAETIPLQGGRLRLWRQWLARDEALRLYETLRRELQWEQSEIRIAGRRVPIPRLNAWYGDPGAAYRYSGVLFEPLAWTASLRALKSRVEQATGHGFNSVLANLYRDGGDGVAWHSDDEPELGEDPAVASLSLGATRRFSLKHRQRRDLRRLDIELPSGALLSMEPPTQRHWCHQVPKTKRAVGPRINLTFRRILL